jgi:hypothetical protein
MMPYTRIFDQVGQIMQVTQVGERPLALKGIEKIGRLVDLHGLNKVARHVGHWNKGYLDFKIRVRFFELSKDILGEDKRIGVIDRKGRLQA